MEKLRGWAGLGTGATTPFPVNASTQGRRQPLSMKSSFKKDGVIGGIICPQFFLPPHLAMASLKHTSPLTVLDLGNTTGCCR